MQAFLVVGAERSGTRLMTRTLIAMGCEGQWSHRQDMDWLIPEAHQVDKPIVVRRGLPHAGEWPLISQEVKQLREAGYEPHIVWIIRDMYPACVSKWNTFGIELDASYDEYQGALRRIVEGAQIAEVPYTVVTYLGLAHHFKDLTDWLHMRLELEKPEPFEVYDGDKKWWEPYQYVGEGHTEVETQLR